MIYLDQNDGPICYKHTASMAVKIFSILTTANSIIKMHLRVSQSKLNLHRKKTNSAQGATLNPKKMRNALLQGIHI